MKYVQIRVKSLEFIEQESISVYFYDVTHHIETMNQEKKIIEQENRQEYKKNDQIMISNEFRTPLSTILMLLDSFLSLTNTSGMAKETIGLVISQINLLLCLVNDQMDLRMIDLNQFEIKNQRFAPAETFNFILNMFAPQVKMINTKISFKSYAQLTKPSDLLTVNSDREEPLPAKLIGDHVRMK